MEDIVAYVFKIKILIFLFYIFYSLIGTDMTYIILASNLRSHISPLRIVYIYLSHMAQVCFYVSNDCVGAMFVV